jgi:hypothetical protein
MRQALLFPELAPPSSSIVGLRVIPPRSCQCGECIAITGSSCGPHHASLTCSRCGFHRGWLSGEAFRFLSDVIDRFGRPTEPVVIRHNQSVPSADTTSRISTHTKEQDMHIDQLYPSRFLRCADLNGRPRRVTIAGLKREDVGGEQKNVLAFTDETLLILNKTNARAIAKSLGCDDTKDWRGKSITLVPAVTDFKGDTVDCIRIRPAKPQAEEEPPFDDDMDDGLEDLIGPERTA